MQRSARTVMPRTEHPSALAIPRLGSWGKVDPFAAWLRTISARSCEALSPHGRSPATVLRPKVAPRNGPRERVSQRLNHPVSRAAIRDHVDAALPLPSRLLAPQWTLDLRRTPVPLTARHRRRLFVIVLYAGLVLVGWWIGMQWDRLDETDIRSLDPAMMVQILAVALTLFVLLSSIPFIPGAEIGFGLMVVFGGKVAVLVYAAMVSALTLSYLVGALVPPRWIVGFFRYLGFQKATRLVEDLAARDRRARIDYLMEVAPQRWVPALLRHRYLAMMLVLNLPGNSLVGGGGGLALAAGMSGLFRFPLFLASVLVAVAPIPLVFLLAM